MQMSRRHHTFVDDKMCERIGRTRRSSVARERLKIVAERKRDSGRMRQARCGVIRLLAFGAVCSSASRIAVNALQLDESAEVPLIVFHWTWTRGGWKNEVRFVLQRESVKILVVDRRPEPRQSFYVLPYTGRDIKSPRSDTEVSLDAFLGEIASGQVSLAILQDSRYREVASADAVIFQLLIYLARKANFESVTTKWFASCGL